MLQRYSGCKFCFVTILMRALCLLIFVITADSSTSSDNSLSEAGAASICQALGKNTTLQSLDLGSEHAAAKRVGRILLCCIVKLR
jgi:hypothetical protein